MIDDPLTNATNSNRPPHLAARWFSAFCSRPFVLDIEKSFVHIGDAFRRVTVP